MRRRLPPLNTLKVFEAAARHTSFTHAAQELCVTQGAVSQQVKALEQALGLKLFQREHQRLVITEAGRGYLEVVRDALDRIASGTERLLHRQTSGVLTVSTSPNFAAKWLVHRLAGFARAHPEIDLRISASLHHVDFVREEIDLAIRHGDGQANGLHITQLCREELVVICSPKLLSGKNGLRKPSDLARHTLLHVNDRKDWSQWLHHSALRGVALENIDVSRGPIFNQASMAIDAAINAQGVALARSALAAWDLIDGRLVRPFELSLPVPYSYWIVCPKATAMLPKIVVFRDWLLSEAAHDLKRSKALDAGNPTLKGAALGYMRPQKLSRKR